MFRTSLLRTTTFALAGFAACTIGCSKKAEPVSGARVTKASGAPVAAANSRPETNDDDPSKHGQRRKRGIDTPVFVDGKQLAVLRYGEIPSGLVPRTNAAGGNAVYYRWVDYLGALGIKKESVKAIHVRGQRGFRIASIEGNELVARANELTFQFLGGKSGIAFQTWETTHLKNDIRINELGQVMIYVDKPAPALDKTLTCYAKDGACVDDVPYSPEGAAIAKGTRVYVDGKMVGFVKRRQVTDALSLGRDDRDGAKYSVVKLLVQMGVDLAGAKDVELMAGDDVVGRMAATELATTYAGLSFTLSPHAHGQVRVLVPAAAQAPSELRADKTAEITAVRIAHKAPASGGPLESIEDEPEPSAKLSDGEAETASD